MSCSLQPSSETEVNFSLEGRSHNTSFCLRQCAASILTHIYIADERINSNSFISFEWRHFEIAGKKKKLRSETPLNMLKVGGFLCSVSSASLPLAPRFSKIFLIRNFEPEPKSTGDGTLFLSFRECTIFLPCCRRGQRPRSSVKHTRSSLWSRARWFRRV